MNINRNNYEEYFILYADGELDEAARRAVDAFVKQHPDLADELQLFADLRLTPTATPAPAMPNKESLLRPEVWDAENLTPTQLQLLNLLDQEVTSNSAGNLHTQLPLEWELLKQTRLQPTPHAMPERHRLLHTQAWNAEALSADQLVLLEALANDSTTPEMELLLQADEWKKEWHLLQQTRLQPALFAMPGKRSLMRHEEAPVVAINWRRALTRSLAAAAVMSGLGWFLFSNPSPKTTNPTDEIVMVQPETGANTAGTRNSNEAKPDANPGTVSLEAGSPATETAKTNTASTPSAKLAGGQKTTSQELARHTQQVTDEKQSYRLTETEVQQLRDLHNVTDANVASVEIPKVDKPVVDLNFAEPEARETPITLASFEVDAEEQDDRFITIAGARVSKQKIKGLWRSVSRTVVRSASQTEIGNTIQTVAANIKQP